MAFFHIQIAKRNFVIKINSVPEFLQPILVSHAVTDAISCSLKSPPNITLLAFGRMYDRSNSPPPRPICQMPYSRGRGGCQMPGGGMLMLQIDRCITRRNRKRLEHVLRSWGPQHSTPNSYASNHTGNADSVKQGVDIVPGYEKRT